MRLISIRDLRSQTRRIGEWLSAAEEVVVTSNGRPIAILSPLTEDTGDIELMAQRQTRAFRAFNRIQEISHQSGVDQLSDEDIDQEIAAVRRTHAESKCVVDVLVIVSASLKAETTPAAAVRSRLNGGALFAYDARILLEYHDVLLQP